MQVLLTGGTGYIASHTALTLVALGHQVILFDNLFNSSITVLEKLAQISNHEFTFVQGDVRNTELLIETINSHKIDAVIHFAGLKAVGESVEKPIDYYSNNVQGAISLLQAMKTCQIKTLVFSSSATVYGEPKYLPFDENHPTSATSPYGRSKLQVEEILQDVSSSDALWKIVCLRYFNPVGAHDSGLIGENPKGIPNNLMPYIGQVASGQRKELSIFGNDYETLDGTGLRDYIHVMDLAQGHVAALEFLQGAQGCHAINLGTGMGRTVLEVVKAFEAASGKRIPYRFVSRRAGDVAAYFADTSKAKQLLNWKATRTLEDMCASTWRFQQSLSSSK